MYIIVNPRATRYKYLTKCPSLACQAMSELIEDAQIFNTYEDAKTELQKYRNKGMKLTRYKIIEYYDYCI